MKKTKYSNEEDTKNTQDTEEDKTEKDKTKKESGEEEEEFWSDENLVEDEDEDLEEINPEKLEYTKIKDLETGMDNVNVEGVIDFIGDTHGKDYGEEPYAVGFIKDKTGEIKLAFWGDDLTKAKKGKKIRVINGYVSEFRGQIQLNCHRQRGIDFL